MADTTAMPSVHLHYWAGARAAAGTVSEEVDAATVRGALALAAAGRDARFARVLAACSLLVDGLAAHDADLDAPLPPVPPVSAIRGNKSRAQLIHDLAARENLTVREILVRLAGGRGHRVLVGTPEQVADDLQTWFERGAADGFNIMAPTLPGGLEAFVDEVVPVLQRRGLFRTEYEGRTLREHYGLARPAVGALPVAAGAGLPAQATAPAGAVPAGAVPALAEPVR